MVELTKEQKAAEVAIRLRGVDPKFCAIIMDVVGDAGSVTLTLNCSIEFRWAFEISKGVIALFKDGTAGLVDASTANIFHVKAVNSESDLEAAAKPGDHVVFLNSIFKQ